MDETAALATDTSAVATDTSALLGPGAQLASQREARGWTVEQVARQLNLAPRQIQALEADNHAALPGVASVRGFIRSYAKLLRVEAEPLLSLMPGDAMASLTEPIPMRRALSKPFTDDRVNLMSRRSRMPWKTLIFFVVVGVAVAIAYIADSGRWWAAIRPFALPVAHDIAVTRAAQPVALNAPSAPAASLPVATVEEATTVEKNNEPVAVPAEEPASESAQPAPAVADADALVLTFREESWLEATRIGKGNRADETLATRLVPAGSIIKFDARQPLAVVIGNVAGVDATLRGKPFDLKRDSKTNVARITLK